MDVEACKSLLAAAMNNPIPKSVVLGPPAPWGLGYNGTKQNGDWGAICREWWLLRLPFCPW